MNSELKNNPGTRSPIRYLLVDDEKDWLLLITELAKTPALAVCEDPQSALEILEGRSVEVVITDTNMGSMSGIDLLRKIRSEPRWDSVAVIVLFSGLAGQALSKDDILKMGATAVLSKHEFLACWFKVIQP